MRADRSAIVAEARSWLGTPFHPRAHIKGAGVDCAHLLIAVYSTCGLMERFTPEPYADDWFLHQSGPDLERFLRSVERCCVRVERPQVGDVALYRYGRAVSHGAIVSAAGERVRVIHAFRSRGVIEEEASGLCPLARRLDSYWSFACLG